MNNPYTTLGVSEGANDEEIKKAYRDKIVEYSSEEYQDEPNASLAAKMLNEYNAAYDEIMARRRTGASANTQSSNSAGDSRFADIRTLIRNGDIGGAEQKLLSFSAGQRNAEWNFLMACVMREKGWLDEACTYASNASSLEPSNTEYKMLYDQLMNGLGNKNSYPDFSKGQQRTANGPTYANTTSGGCCDGDDCGNLCQCLCMYSICQSCCCNGN